MDNEVEEEDFDDIQVRGKCPIVEIYQRAKVAILEHVNFEEVETTKS